MIATTIRNLDIEIKMKISRMKYLESKKTHIMVSIPLIYVNLKDYEKPIQLYV